VAILYLGYHGNGCHFEFCVYAAMSKSSKQLQNFIEIQYGCHHYTKFLHRNQWGKNKQQSSLKPLNHLKAKMIAISLR
jgi:hypothetical protein